MKCVCFAYSWACSKITALGFCQMVHPLRMNAKQLIFCCCFTCERWTCAYTKRLPQDFISWNIVMMLAFWIKIAAAKYVPVFYGLGNDLQRQCSKYYLLNNCDYWFMLYVVCCIFKFTFCWRTLSKCNSINRCCAIYYLWMPFSA